MKEFRIILLLVFILLIDNIFIFGQCASIELYSQEEVNNFIKRYGNCKTVQNLKISDPKNDLIQFDSLYHIERIEGRFELQNIIEAKKNLDGFRNLKFVNNFNLYASNISNVFVALDTVNHLTVSYDSSTFRALDNLKYIKNSLRFNPIDYCQSNHLSNFTTSSNFTLILGLESTIPSNCLERLSHNIASKNLRNLQLRGAYHVLNNLNFIDSIEVLIIKSEESDISAIKNLTNLNHIEIWWDMGNNNFGEGFKRTYDLDTLRLNHNKSIKNYYNIFPSLKTVSGQLEIIGNDALLNLEFLKDVTLPNELNDSVAILIQDNKLLNDCNVTFLCEVLNRYPESVIIRNNGAKCTKEEIIKYCKTVNTNDTNKSQLLISPNPTNGNLKIENLASPATVTITNINGQTFKTIQNVKNEVDVTELPAGMYIIDIRNKDISERHKIVKVE